MIAHTTVQIITADELASTTIYDDLKAFDIAVTTRLGDAMHDTFHDEPQNRFYLEDVDDGTYEPQEPEAEMPETFLLRFVCQKGMTGF